MSVLRPELFQRETPKVSVVLPIFSGMKNPHAERLLKELSKQSFQSFEVLIVEGASPNGHARNVGVRETKGEFLLFIDEGSSLGSDQVIENLLQVFLARKKVGIAGASNQSHRENGWLQRQYRKSRNFESPLVKELTESWQVQHACMMIPKAVYEEVGGESDWLLTGTDNDLRQRVHAKGYAMLLVPETWVEFTYPKSYWKMLSKGLTKGRGSAYAFYLFPGLFEELKPFGTSSRNPLLAMLWKVLVAVFKIFRPRFLFNPVALSCEWFVVIGFIQGSFMFWGQKPYKGRPDLPYLKEKGVT